MWAVMKARLTIDLGSSACEVEYRRAFSLVECDFEADRRSIVHVVNLF